MTEVKESFTVCIMVKLLRRTGRERKVSDEYGTPLHIYNALNQIYKFELDVCASKKNHKHSNYYTIKEDGLEQPWSRMNFCNPPYSNILPWYEKALEEAVKGNKTVFLSKWDHSTRHGYLAMKYFKEIQFIKERIQFEGADVRCNFPCFIGLVTLQRTISATYKIVTFKNLEPVK